MTGETTISPTVLQFDLVENTARIAELERIIVDAQKELTFRRDLDLFGRRLFTNGKDHKTNGVDLPAAEVDNIGISDFILGFLKAGPMETSAIIQAYAIATGKQYDDVNGNISNALNRLRKLGKIRSTPNEGGKRAGNTWYLKK